MVYSYFGKQATYEKNTEVRQTLQWLWINSIMVNLNLWVIFPQQSYYSWKNHLYFHDTYSCILWSIVIMNFEHLLLLSYWCNFLKAEIRFFIKRAAGVLLCNHEYSFLFVWTWRGATLRKELNWLHTSDITREEFVCTRARRKLTQCRIAMCPNVYLILKIEEFTL